MSIDTSKQTAYVAQGDLPVDEVITTKQTCYVVLSLKPNAISQVAAEVITNINPVNTDPLKLCLPFDETLTESFTQDQSPSIHPVDMTTGGLPTIDATPSQFGGGAVNVAATDWLRVLLPQPDFNFTGNFTIEFWIFRNATGGIEDVMGQWPSTTDKGWRIRFNVNNLEFEWTPDGSTVNTEVITFTIPVSTWTHLAFENFSTVFTVYIDGFAIFNVASITPIHASNGDLFIGKVESSSGGEEFDGLIDEFKIVVGQATFQAPFLTPIASIDCSSIIPPDISWDPGNLGQQNECEESLFQITVTGIKLVSGTQEFFAVGLPNNMFIDAFGNIFGILPTHTPGPTIMNYEFTVTFLVGGVPLLGPSTFSFDVQDLYLNDIIEVNVPSLLTAKDRNEWKIHLLGLINFTDLFKPTGPNFGVIQNPDLFVINGLTESALLNYQNALTSFDPAIRHGVTIETLKVGTGANFDVLYYSINDTGSTILTFPNPLGIDPTPIEPISIDNIRDLLTTTIGFDSQFGEEVLPDWLSTYEPLIIAAFVNKGTGQAIVDKFNSDAVHHKFKGRTIIVDRLNVTRCSTFWPENAEDQIVIKFDDI